LIARERGKGGRPAAWGCAENGVAAARKPWVPARSLRWCAKIWVHRAILGGFCAEFNQYCAKSRGAGAISQVARENLGYLRNSRRFRFELFNSRSPLLNNCNSRPKNVYISDGSGCHGSLMRPSFASSRDLRTSWRPYETLICLIPRFEDFMAAL
jgi:hypothetical protein